MEVIWEKFWHCMLTIPVIRNTTSVCQRMKHTSVFGIGGFNHCKFLMFISNTEKKVYIFTFAKTNWVSCILVGWGRIVRCFSTGSGATVHPVPETLFKHLFCPYYCCTFCKMRALFAIVVFILISLNFRCVCLLI